MKMKTLKDYRLLTVILVVICFAVVLGAYISSHTAPSQTREQEWQSFKTYVSSLRWPDQTPIYSGTSTMGCFAHEAIKNSSLGDCTFSGTYFYAPKASYRQSGKEIYAFLQQHGFYFDDKDRQQKFESKLRDTKITDNLSNSEPIIVDLKNKNGVWVRLSIGDKGRLMMRGSGEVDQALRDVKDDELIARFNFFKTL